MHLLAPVRQRLPGLLLVLLVAGAALLAAGVETRLVGRPWLEPLVLAILFGALVRSLRTLPASFDKGIDCAARPLLEAAVALMGAAISFAAIRAAGMALMVAIIATVASSILLGFLLGRLFGLPKRLAMLVACGNAICGNSAIAAVAPVIDAEGEDVATAIAFTAVLGIAVVIAIPFAAAALHLGPAAGGVLAGLTVYAVPQVLAAAAPLGPTAVQIGTLVKLVRVLMLGPVVTGLSLIHGQKRPPAACRRSHRPARFLPPFILGFLALATLRSIGLLPAATVAVARQASEWLTVLAMAGLGLGVDLRSVTAAGARVAGVAIGSILLLASIALAVVRLIGLA